MKKLSVYILIFCAASMLCGCGFFDYEYVVIEDYAPAVQAESGLEETIKVRNITSLKLAIQTIINNGDTEGKIVFDAAYDGDPVADMSKACWQVRTQDALCAYCVADISYELSKIVTYYEAKLNIGYTDYVDDAANIVQLPYSTGIEMIIRQALEEGDTKLVMLVDHSSYSAEDVVSLVSTVYRRNPATAPKEPDVNINMYSGANMQRLYEVNFIYGMSEHELQQRKMRLKAYAPFENEDLSLMEDAQKALIAYEYLCDNIIVENESDKSTVYDALIGGSADSEGIALAYIELCRQLELECLIVYGQHDWKDHCWNIVKAGNSFYHVDAGLTDSRNPAECFMQSDEAFWETYRWDMSSYPACTPMPESTDVPEDSLVEAEGNEYSEEDEAQYDTAPKEDDEESVEENNEHDLTLPESLTDENVEAQELASDDDPDSVTELDANSVEIEK